MTCSLWINELRLGGFFEPGLHVNGPTPQNLVLNAGVVLIPPPVPVPAGGLLPQFTRPKFFEPSELADWLSRLSSTSLSD